MEELARIHTRLVGALAVAGGAAVCAALFGAVALAAPAPREWTCPADAFVSAATQPRCLAAPGSASCLVPARSVTVGGRTWCAVAEGPAQCGGDRHSDYAFTALAAALAAVAAAAVMFANCDLAVLGRMVFTRRLVVQHPSLMASVRRAVSRQTKNVGGAS